jgi:hypothetical protein
MRYLGKVVEAIQGIQQLSYLTVRFWNSRGFYQPHIIQRIARLELLCRTVRHLFRAFVQEVEATCMGSAVAHFLNCLVGSGNIPSNPLHESTADGGNNGGSTATSTANNKKAGGTGKKKRRPGERNGGPPIGGGNSPTPKSMAWTKLTQKALWKQIGQESEAHFGLSIPADWCGQHSQSTIDFYSFLLFSCDTFIDWSGGAQRTAIVRRFCTMNGVQILLRVNSRHRSPFNPKINFYANSTELPIRRGQGQVAGSVHRGGHLQPGAGCQAAQPSVTGGLQFLLERADQDAARIPPDWLRSDAAGADDDDEVDHSNPN